MGMAFSASRVARDSLTISMHWNGRTTRSTSRRLPGQISSTREGSSPTSEVLGSEMTLGSSMSVTPSKNDDVPLERDTRLECALALLWPFDAVGLAFTFRDSRSAET